MNIRIKPEKSGGDRRYLSQPRGAGTTWYVSVEVPRTLQRSIGKKRLVRSLETDDIRVARAARWRVVADMKAEIANTPSASSRDKDNLRREAMAYREEYLKADAGRRNDLEYEIEERAQQIDLAAGGKIEEIPHGFDEPTPATKQASDFAQLARGKATPVDIFVDRWLGASNYTERTKADARTAISQFKVWCDNSGKSFFIESITDRVASDFRDEEFVAKNVHPKTANKKLSAIRQYWVWLDKSFGGHPNPWLQKSLPKQKAHRIDQDGPQGDERPFTDAEVSTLLKGPTDAELAAVIRIAALSGMRLDEIGQLRIVDCADDTFSVRRGKTAAARRTIPIHSALRPLIAKLKGSRDAGLFLFPDLSDSGWDDNRTMAISKRFAYFRKKMKVDDKRPGARRSKVNFHSFRRWFATKAEEAGNRENVVADIMGHSGHVGITFGLYSKAKMTLLKVECVESVMLPE